MVFETSNSASSCLEFEAKYSFDPPIVVEYGPAFKQSNKSTTVTVHTKGPSYSITTKHGKRSPKGVPVAG